MISDLGGWDKQATDRPSTDEVVIWLHSLVRLSKWYPENLGFIIYEFYLNFKMRR